MTHALSALLLVAICAAPAATARGPTDARIDYLLHHAAQGQQWEITVSVSGLEGTPGPITLDLDEWGGWPQVESLRPRVLEADPPVTASGPTQFTVVPAPGRLTALRVKYAITLNVRGDERYQRCGAWPWRTEAFAFGYAINTLMRVHAAGVPLQARRTVTITAPRGVPIVTGWGGAAEREQTITLAGDVDNALLFFGAPSFTSRAIDDGLAFEVFQFGTGRDITAPVLALARTLVPAYGKSTGRKKDTPVRIFIEDVGSGGVRTDHGIAVRWTPDEGVAGDSPYFQHTVAHELYHDWLGGYLAPPGETTVWLHEGFTDYLALWHLARTTTVSREWFAERLHELDDAARASSAFGQVAFADRASWRDGDGPIETLAYKGGAVLAFLLDVALREAGRAGLSELIADLLREQRYTLASVKAWFEAHGLGAVYAEYVEHTGLPDLHEALEIVGFAKRDAMLPLTYLGIQSTAEPFGTIVALDPDGPAARAGLQVGDTITGFSPTRSSRPDIGAEVTTPYRFGLSWFDPEALRVRIGIRRSGASLHFEIQPRRIVGGHGLSWHADPEITSDFFWP